MAAGVLVVGMSIVDEATVMFTNGSAPVIKNKNLDWPTRPAFTKVAVPLVTVVPCVVGHVGSVAPVVPAVVQMYLNPFDVVGVVLNPTATTVLADHTASATGMLAIPIAFDGIGLVGIVVADGLAAIINENAGTLEEVKSVVLILAVALKFVGVLTLRETNPVCPV